MKNHLRKSPGNVPDGHQKIEPKTARTLLVIAAALLIIALAWRFFLEKNSFSGGIVRSLAQHGCNIEADADLMPTLTKQGMFTFCLPISVMNRC